MSGWWSRRRIVRCVRKISGPVFELTASGILAICGYAIPTTSKAARCITKILLLDASRILSGWRLPRNLLGMPRLGLSQVVAEPHFNERPPPPIRWSTLRILKPWRGPNCPRRTSDTWQRAVDDDRTVFLNHEAYSHIEIARADLSMSAARYPRSVLEVYGSSPSTSLRYRALRAFHPELNCSGRA